MSKAPEGGLLATTGADAAVMSWLITGAIAAAGGAMLVFGIRRSQGEFSSTSARSTSTETAER